MVRVQAALYCNRAHLLSVHILGCTLVITKFQQELHQTEFITHHSIVVWSSENFRNYLLATH